MKFNIEKRNIWFISDSHFGHSGICRGTTHWRVDDENGNKIIPLSSVRDFDTVEEMNETMVNNINDCVSRNDILFHLGDWSFGGIEKVSEFREKINCNTIHLLLGNHDDYIENNKNNVRRLFTTVNEYIELKIGKNKGSKNFILFHYPISSWNHLRRNGFMLHGHDHLKGDKRFGNGKRMDVGICGSPEFRPYHLDEIIDLLKDREMTGIENRL